MIIYLKPEHFKHLEKVESYVNTLLLTDPEFSGDEYTIEPDDFTWIDSDNEIRDTYLLGSIINLLDEPE